MLTDIGEPPRTLRVADWFSSRVFLCKPSMTVSSKIEEKDVRDVVDAASNDKCHGANVIEFDKRRC